LIFLYDKFVRRIFLAFAIIFFLSLLHFKATNAYASSSITINGFCTIFYLCPNPSDPGNIDETITTVTVKFDNLIPNTNYYICLKKKFSDCIGPTHPNLAIVPLAVENLTSDSDGTVSITVCGDRDNNLKINCDSNRDSFGGGLTYTVSVVNPQDTNFGATQTYSFYVHYYFPEEHNIVIASFHSAQWLKPEPGKSIDVVIKQDRQRSGPKGPPGPARDENNYILELQSNNTNYKAVSDWKIPTTNDPAISVPKGQDALGLEAGSYTLSIKGYGANENVTYYQADVEVDPTNGSIGILEKDPFFSDAPSADSSASPTPPPPPCAEFETNGPTKGSCKTVNTAIGPLGTAPQDFIKSIFGLILGLSGGLALLLIIYSGYQMMAAQGKPETLQAARDQLIAAIIGLIFIIFSLVILQIIGVDILKIPQFKP